MKANKMKKVNANMLRSCTCDTNSLLNKKFYSIFHQIFPDTRDSNILTATHFYLLFRMV
jgi:hypothetical protein